GHLHVPNSSISLPFCLLKVPAVFFLAHYRTFARRAARSPHDRRKERRCERKSRVEHGEDRRAPPGGREPGPGSPRKGAFNCLAVKWLRACLQPIRAASRSSRNWSDWKPDAAKGSHENLRKSAGVMVCEYIELSRACKDNSRSTWR